MTTTTLVPPPTHRSELPVTATALARALRTVLRLPVLFLSPLSMSVFFLAIYSGQLEQVGSTYLGGVSFGTFILPLILVTGAVTAAAATGELLVRDVKSGYLDRLVLAHGSVRPYVVAAALTGMLIVVAHSCLVVLAGFFVGFEAASVADVALLVGYAVALGLGVGLLGAAVALRFAESSMVNMVTVAFFGLSFFTGFLAPAGQLAGWLKAVSVANPLTYVLEAMRDTVAPQPSASHVLAVLILTAVVVLGAAGCAWATGDREARR